MPKSIFLLPTTVCLLCLFLPLVLGQSWRNYPVPPFPRTVLQGQSADTSAAESVDPWTSYLIYIGVVSALPILAGLLLFSATVGICTIRMCSHFCPGPFRGYSRKNMSPWRIRLLNVVPHLAMFALILFISVCSIAFFLWMLIEYRYLRVNAFTTTHDTVGLPDRLIQSTNQLRDTIPVVTDRLVSVLDNATSFATSMELIDEIVFNTKSQIERVKPLLDHNNEIFNRVKTRQRNMVAKSYDRGMEDIQFDSFEESFANASESIDREAIEAVENLQNSVGDGLSQVQGVVDAVRDKITQFNHSLSVRLATFQTKVEEIVGRANSAINMYASHEKLDNYEHHLNLVEIGVGICFVLAMCIVALILTLSFVWTCFLVWPCLKLTGCCIALCIIPYALTASVALLAFFVIDDACRQGEDYIRASEKAWDLSFAVPPLPGTSNTTTLRYSDVMLGVLNCPEGGNILDASSLSLDTFNVPTLIDSYENEFRIALQNFDWLEFAQDAEADVKRFHDNVLVGDVNFKNETESLNEDITSCIKQYFSLFPMSLTLRDFESQDAQLTEMNSILQMHDWQPLIMGSDILKFTPRAWATDPITPGMIGAFGVGENFTAIDQAVIDPVQRNRVWGNLALYENGTTVAPGIVERGLVFNLSRLFAPDPINTQAMYQDYLLMKADLDNLTASISVTQNYTSQIFQIQSDISAVMLSLNNTVEETRESVPELMHYLVDTVEKQVTDTSVLRCSFIGSFYNSTQQAVCNDLRVSIGGFGASVLMMVFLLFAMFLVLLWAECLAMRKSSTESPDYDDDGPVGAK